MPVKNQNNKLEEGISLYKKNKYVDALTSFLALTNNDDIDEVELSYYLGLCNSKLGRYEEALTYLEQVVTDDADNLDSQQKSRLSQCRYLLAVIYVKTGRNSLADYELNKILETDYKKASVYASLAYITWQKGDVDSCIELYEKALEIDENNPTALNGLGYVLSDSHRDLTRALSLCKKAVSIAPESSACLDSLGWSYYNLGRRSDCLKYLNKALEKDRDNEIILEHIKQAGVEE